MSPRIRLCRFVNDIHRRALMPGARLENLVAVKSENRRRPDTRVTTFGARATSMSCGRQSRL
jgi:hypothetical protein